MDFINVGTRLRTNVPSVRKSTSREAMQPQQRHVHAVRLPGRSHAAKAQLFIAHLKKEFEEPAVWDEKVNGLRL